MPSIRVVGRYPKGTKLTGCHIKIFDSVNGLEMTNARALSIGITLEGVFSRVLLLDFESWAAKCEKNDGTVDDGQPEEFSVPVEIESIDIRPEE